MMDIADAIAFNTASLKQAINTSMMKKVMHQDAQSMQAVLEMSKDVAKMTGVGQNFDMKI